MSTPEPKVGRHRASCPKHGVAFTSHEIRCTTCNGYGLCLDCLVEHVPPGQRTVGPDRASVIASVPEVDRKVYCFTCALGGASKERHRQNRAARNAAERFA